MDQHTFVGIGEVLFDIFEDGTETLGGAPLNFAVHIHQLANHLGVGRGLVVSSTGSDTRGDKIIKSLEGRKMPSQYIIRDSHPTGRVSVFMKNGEPGYQIEADAAWDYIFDGPELKDLAGRCSAICFGSLAQRCSVSRNTIRNFLKNTQIKAIRLYDVNLRQNSLTGEAGYSREIIAYSCQAATIIKANQSELKTMFDVLGITCPSDNSIEGVRHRMEILLGKFSAEAIIVTRGEQGTVALNSNGEFVVTGSRQIKQTIHPVGAGDACSAGILFGLTLKWDLHTTMELANRLGADVAAYPSAIPPISEETLSFAQSILLGN